MKTHRDEFYEYYGINKDMSLSINDISRISGISKKILQQVYNRGVGAWKTNISSVRLKKDFSKNPDTTKYPRSTRLTKEQWGFARIYSFVTGGTTFHTADSDLAKQIT